MGILTFLLGLSAGGTVTFFLAGVLSARRISQYRLINEKLRWQNKRLAVSLPKEARKNILGFDVCALCGNPIPEGEMICDNCLRDEM